MFFLSYQLAIRIGHKRIWIWEALLWSTDYFWSFLHGNNCWSLFEILKIGVAKREADLGSWFGKGRISWPPKIFVLDQHGWSFYHSDPSIRHDANNRPTKPYGARLETPCTVGVYIDMDQHKLWYFLNGKGYGCAFSNLEGRVYPAVSLAVDCVVELVPHPKFFPKPTDLQVPWTVS